MEMIQIGKCIGCMKMAVLDDGVGKCCLNHPRRGRKWAHTANKIRGNQELMNQVWLALTNESARQEFIEIFGKPSIVDKCASMVKLTLIKSND